MPFRVDVCLDKAVLVDGCRKCCSSTCLMTLHGTFCSGVVHRAPQAILFRHRQCLVVSELVVSSAVSCICAIGYPKKKRYPIR
jgi:hypothetical protein